MFPLDAVAVKGKSGDSRKWLAFASLASLWSREALKPGVSSDLFELRWLSTLQVDVDSLCRWIKTARPGPAAPPSLTPGPSFLVI